MKQIFFSFAFLLYSFFLIGCSSDSNSSPQTVNCTSTIPFLETGTTLTYKTTQFGFDSGTLKFTIGNCNGAGFLVSQQVFAPNGSLYSSATNLWKQDGDFFVTDANNDGDYFSKIYKKNAVLGEFWEEVRPSDNATVRHELVDLDSLITVPAGTFNCKVIKYTNTSIINESYIFWVEDIGQIKEDAGFLVNELISY